MQATKDAHERMELEAEEEAEGKEEKLIVSDDEDKEGDARLKTTVNE